MRIVFVTPEYITEDSFDGGLANYLSRVAPALAGLGHDVTIIVRSHVNERLELNGVHVHRVAIFGPPLFCFGAVLRSLHTPLDWTWQSWKINRTLRELHRAEPFDIVQYASYTAIGLFRIKSLAATIRLSSYEPLLRQVYGLEQTFSRRLQVYLEEKALKRADGLFSPSDLVAGVAGEKLKVPVRVIESPYVSQPVALDSQPYRDILSGKRYLLYYGSISVHKGSTDIAAIIATLLENHPELHFVFVGKDLGCHGRPVMDLIWESAGSSRGRVLYLGRMRHSQLLPILQHAAGVVLPSRVDNFPNTCIEAMACAKVVIGTYGTSFEQLIVAGTNGLLCSPANPGSLLDTVEKLLLMEAGTVEEMGNRARARIEQLSGTGLVNELVDFYNYVLKVNSR